MPIAIAVGGKHSDPLLDPIGPYWHQGLGSQLPGHRRIRPEQPVRLYSRGQALEPYPPWIFRQGVKSQKTQEDQAELKNV